MKTAGLNKTNLTLCLLVLSLFSLTGCPDGGSSKNRTASPYTNLSECQNQTVPVGVPGNTACPYLGDYDPNRGYQPYSVQFGAGIGFYIDFGWHYRDNCPQEGQLEVYQNGGFSHCTGVSDEFGGARFQGYQSSGLGECVGDQYNPGITGCGANLRPIPPRPYFY